MTIVGYVKLNGVLTWVWIWISDDENGKNNNFASIYPNLNSGSARS